MTISHFNRNLSIITLARVLAVLGFISSAFLLFLLTAANPFLRLMSNVPLNGNDLNPILQDPGLAIHPPILYMGYVGFTIIFAFAVAALMGNEKEKIWIHAARPWTLIAWSFLTGGITFGSWWAYRELGWGGWWFWDPVENAAFLPWLSGTALIHSLCVTEKRHAFKSWTILLAICTFALCLLGTFLVRSGVLISVHSFAIDSARGTWMLSFLGTLIAGALLLYIWRAPRLRSDIAFNWFSRETFLLLNNIFLMTLMFTVLLGTLYPLVMDSLGQQKISIGAPYFNSVFIPLMLPLLLCMAVGPLMRWGEDFPYALIKRIGMASIVTIMLAIMLPWFFTKQFSSNVSVGIILALLIMLSTLQSSFRRILLRQPFTRTYCGMMFAHIGVAVCILGIVLTSHYSIERNVRLRTGEQLSLGPYQFHFTQLNNITGPNFQSIAAKIDVRKGDQVMTVLQPAEKYFPAQQVTIPKASIFAGWWYDLYTILGEPIPGANAWTFRIYYKPFVRWIWLGGILILLGGLLAASDKRYWMKFTTSKREIFS